MLRIPLVATLALFATSAFATDRAVCEATIAGVQEARQHMAEWKAEWGEPGGSSDVDLSAAYSGAELAAMKDVTAAHEAFVNALADYDARLKIAELTIGACADQ